MMKEKTVTFAVLSCKRTHILGDVVGIFKKNCIDHGLVDKWLIIDDSHSHEHQKIVESFSDFETIIKPLGTHGHASSLNILLDYCDSGYLIYWEDDSVLAKNGAWISQAIKILQQNPDLLQITFDQKVFTSPWHQDNLSIGLKSEPYPHRIFCDPPNATFVAPTQFVFYADFWPGFTLRPHILDMDRFHERVKRRFDVELRQNFEYDMGLTVRNAGLLTSSFINCDVFDFGDIPSSYSINNEKRDFERIGGLYSFEHFQKVAKECSLRTSPSPLKSRVKYAWRWMRTDKRCEQEREKNGKLLVKSYHQVASH